MGLPGHSPEYRGKGKGCPYKSQSTEEVLPEIESRWKSPDFPPSTLLSCSRVSIGRGQGRLRDVAVIHSGAHKDGE